MPSPAQDNRAAATRGEMSRMLMPVLRKGGDVSAADVVIGANIRWGTMFKLVPERPEFTAYAARIAARPAVQRAESKDKQLGA
jgi:glutathione S-transferase